MSAAGIASTLRAMASHARRTASGSCNQLPSRTGAIAGSNVAASSRRELSHDASKWFAIPRQAEIAENIPSTPA